MQCFMKSVRPLCSLRKHPFLLVSRETSPAAKSEEKRMFSQANLCDMFLLAFLDLTVRKVQ